MRTEAIKKTGSAPDPEQWVALYGNAMYRYALVRLSDPEIAQDMVQEALVAALDAYKRFEGKSSVKTWLIAILKRKIVDHFRRAKNYQKVDDFNEATVGIDRMFDDSGHWSAKPNEWDVNPIKAYEQQEFIDILYQCIAKLPDRLAEIFMLREFEEMSTVQICRQLEITESNTWVMLYRARMQLRKCLETNWLHDLQ
ncbi:MAG: sigma-70 family RNA polymerase sigma factor [Desulfobacteraceae bacterium]|jgi:RNA polymerase sigma-70 factor (ECF subfamily)